MKYVKSEAGQQAFKARSPLLSTRQRALFLLFDGTKSSNQVLAMTTGLGVTPDDVDCLVGLGFLVAVPAAARATPAVPTAPVSVRSPQERYRAAMPLATQLTASLGLRGFRLNLAVEAARGVDDLLALLPKIQEAVGAKPCLGLAQALKA